MTKNKKIPKEIWWILYGKQEEILEYVEECLYDGDDKSAEDGLERVNVIRKFLEYFPLTIIELKKDMILEKLQEKK